MTKSEKNIGFVSTRFSGTDGVTLEAAKWAEVLEKCRHRCFWFGGMLDQGPETGFLVPEAYFHHEKNNRINQAIWGKNHRSSEITGLIHQLRCMLKEKLYEFIKKFGLNLLIVENALTIPMHVPLGLALAELIAETQIPTIAHHHDFYWERVRFSVNAVSEYLRMAFPPYLNHVLHVVINSAAQEELALRTGISSMIIPNVLDFDNPPVVDVKRTEKFRHSIGLTPDDIMILQPTRIIQRKGIEHAIELVKELNNPRYKLVISHVAGDEGFEYSNWLQDHAVEQGVDLRLIEAHIPDRWNRRQASRSEYSLWDVYPFADFITYPSLSEGFGNAFLEGIYFKKPMLVNRYATFVRDIEPQGFDLVVMDGFLTRENVRQVRKIIESPNRREKMVDTNYKIASRRYSYSVLRKQLRTLIISFFGDIR